MTPAVSPRRADTGTRPPKAEDPTPLRAVHTPNFPRAAASARRVAPGDHQPGRQARAGPRRRDHLNAHFRGFQAPKGMALSGDRLALLQIWRRAGIVR